MQSSEHSSLSHSPSIASRHRRRQAKHVRTPQITSDDSPHTQTLTYHRGTYTQQAHIFLSCLRPPDVTRPVPIA